MQTKAYACPLCALPLTRVASSETDLRCSKCEKVVDGRDFLEMENKAYEYEQMGEVIEFILRF